MTMKTIAYLPPQTPRMIDLTRSLQLPHGSLSPNTDPEPKWRIAARQAAGDFSICARALIVAFILLAHLLFFLCAR